MENPQHYYILAWNKLLELAIFKQKSEALAMAKLLAYHMTDKALAIQLQADLHLFFEEKEQAKELYLKAYDLYKQNLLAKQAQAMFDFIQVL